jgi:hypothetical protein
MNEDDKKLRNQALPEADDPYEPPAVISEEIFETLAIACGKTGGAFCIANGGINS